MIESAARPLSLNGLTMPDDFPVADFETIHQRIAPLATTNAERYSHYAGAWNAVSYRFMALAQYGDAFTASVVAHGAAPDATRRYEQERQLFAFFSNGFSVFESLFFGLFAIGSFLNASKFPLSDPKDQRRVTPKATFDTYCATFPNDPMNTALSAILTDTAYKEWQEVRNILTHRSAPGRTFFVTFEGSDAPPGQWKLSNIPLDASTAPQRRAHAARLLRIGLSATSTFVESRFR